MNALKAKEFYRRDVQYIVRDGKALIINEVLPGILCILIL
jgi:preprotein translocase subunit SecA